MTSFQPISKLRLALCAMFFALIGISLAGASTESLPSKSRGWVKDEWIVVLEPEPSLMFMGQTSHTQSSVDTSSPAKPLAPTAPSVTGRRLDVFDADVVAYVAHLDQHRAGVLDEAHKRLGRPLAPKAVFHHVTNGFVSKMSDAEAQQLRQLPGVKSVERNWTHQRQTDRGPEWIGATTLWAPSSQVAFEPTKGEGMVVGIIDSGINWDHVMFQDGAPHTDHSYTNPYPSLLGECDQAEVLCNDKLVGVYDFAAEGTLGKDPDGDGHGTHVAATAAGNTWEVTLPDLSDDPFTLSGVAPNAHIISYKVCFKDHPSDEELDDQCASDAILSALEQAVIDQVDVVNYSIGSDPGDPWRFATAFLPLWEANIPFVTSAGNGGPGAATVGLPANAPWVMAVGNSTHDRAIGATINVGSFTDILVVPGNGPSVNADISANARSVETVSPGNLRACDPLPAGSLSGEIAVVERGDCFFSIKINHAAQAGAVAVIVNNNVSGAATIMDTQGETTIPAVMMSKESGDPIVAALASGPLPATLKAGQRTINNPALGDRMARSSARGPNEYATGIVKPNVIAPGSEILSAFVPDATSVGLLSGTSMSSPHVAGAVALLRSIHPSWGVDALFSALQTTGFIDSVTANGLPANIHDRGNGRVQVDLAARVGLYLPQVATAFRAANPAQGGVPGSLNFPGMINQGCGEVCTFQRTVKAHRAGSWTVGIEGEANVTVTPSSFSLSAGQTQVLSITGRPDPSLLGELEEARVVLTEAEPPAGQTNVTRPVKQTLTVAIANDLMNIPSVVEHATAQSRGQFPLEIDAIKGMARIGYDLSGLSAMDEETFSLVEDPSNGEPYSSDPTGTKTFIVEVPTDAMGLYAEITASAADDIDLFVGLDINGDGKASEDEEFCSSTSPIELEGCWVENPTEGDWWILVQNWTASSTGASDSVDLRFGVASPTESPVLFAAGPGNHIGGPLDVSMYYDDGTLGANDTRLGVLALSDDATADKALLASIPLIIERTTVSMPGHQVLFPNEASAVQLPASTVHDSLVFDVPPTATSLNVEVKGNSGVSASLRRIDFDQLPSHAPRTPPAPDEVLVSGQASSTGADLTLSNPTAGRYYVVLDNTTASAQSIEVTPTIEESGRVDDIRYALYSPVGRDINQGVEFQSSGQPFAVWYSFDDQGLPIFYLGSAPLNASSSVWVSGLDRYTRGDDKQLATPAGRMALTHISRDEAIFSWQLNGAHGSDLVSAAIIPEACVDEGGTKKSYTGHWYSPGRDQGGSTTIMAPGIQIQVRYYYDALGVGRWVQLAAPGAGPEADTLLVKEYRGNCPNCASTTSPNSIDVGVYIRTYDSEASGEEVLVFESRPPLSESFSTEVPIAKLSERLSCP